MAYPLRSAQDMKKKSISELSLPIAFAALFLLSAHFSQAYDEVTVKDGGTIRGSVKLEGKLGRLPALEVSKYKEFCRDVPNESIVVGPAQGLRYAVVTLEGIAKGKAAERETIHELDNVKCRFVPRVQAASVGQFVLLKNSDPILHTAHALFANSQPQFNVGLYPGRTSRKPFVAAGLVKVRCEVHPWMAAYIVVTDHPYHAVSDVYGEYELGEIPPGAYQLKVWHETLGTQEKRIEVKAGAAQKVDFTYALPTGAKK